MKNKKKKWLKFVYHIWRVLKKKKKPKSLQTRSVDRRNYPLFAIKLPPFKSMLRHLVSVSYCNCHLRYIDRGLGVYIKKPFLLKAADYVLSSIYNGHKTSLKLLEIWQSNQLYIVHIHIPAVEIYTCIFLHVTEVFSKAMPSHTSQLHFCVNGRIGSAILIYMYLQI